MENQKFTEKISRHWPASPPQKLSVTESLEIIGQIKELLVEKNAVLIAHYYTDPQIQQLAEETGGFIGDSLEMARFGAEHQAQTLLIAGVRFMGESAKILSPEKRVLMPDLAAECSLDLGCEPAEFKKVCDENPDRVVVVYANTSAEIKALADWTVTSSIAVDVVKHLAAAGKKVLWAPDRYLGDYIQRLTGADMLIWDACCVVHVEFDAAAIRKLKTAQPDAKLLVHPESQPEVIALADVVGSTSQLLIASQNSPARKFIVATESGILYKMHKTMPDKEFIMAPTLPQTDSYNCSADCPWMKMNSLKNIYEALKNDTGEIKIARETITKALRPLSRMLDFKKKNS